MAGRIVRGSLVYSMFVASLSVPVLCLPALAGEPEKKPDLSGPAVTQPETPGPAATLDGGGQRGGKKDMIRPIPHRVLMGAIRSELGPESAESLRLSEDQKASIKKIDEKFKSEMAAYVKEHRGEVEEIRSQAKGGGKGKLRGGDARPAPGDGEQQEMRMIDDPEKLDGEKLKGLKGKVDELRAGGPNPDEARAAIWEVLKEPQRAAVKAKIDEFQVKMSERYAEKETQRKLKKNGEGNLGGPAKPKKKPKDD
jgi:hypothetical protein